MALSAGWGGLASVFDKAKWNQPQWHPDWHKKYGSFHKKLLELMSDEEF